jgi:hypothetical protein
MIRAESTLEFVQEVCRKTDRPCGSARKRAEAVAKQAKK